jgi:guanosine-3',5'-bis(diphosphate) 3'-pyrophosphohydrolase
MEAQTLYQKAIAFATYKHLEKNQYVTGTILPYIVHLSNVAMEIFMAALNTENFNLGFAVQVALLHDIIEDTDTTYDEVKEKFDIDIANAVLALSKDHNLPKEEQTHNSLARIKKLSEEVWAVKLADQITLLQPPPLKWSNDKRIKYQQEASLILNELRYGNGYLSKRFKDKIEEYGDFINIKIQNQAVHHG